MYIFTLFKPRKLHYVCEMHFNAHLFGKRYTNRYMLAKKKAISIFGSLLMRILHGGNCSSGNKTVTLTQCNNTVIAKGKNGKAKMWRNRTDTFKWLFVEIFFEIYCHDSIDYYWIIVILDAQHKSDQGKYLE